MQREDGAERLVSIERTGALVVEHRGRPIDVLAVASMGLLLRERPAGRRNLQLCYRHAGGDIARAIAVRSIEVRKTDGGPAYFLRIARDSRILRLAELANRGPTSPADYVAVASELGTERRNRARTSGRQIGKFAGSAAMLAGATGLFLASAYMRYGVSTFSGSLSASNVELVRAEHPGVFYPYASSGSRLLKVGDLVGVIAATNGRSFGVPASCQCYLGDFPVNAGSTLYKGAVLARLIRPDSVAEASASIPVVDRWQIAAGDPVELDVGGRLVDGHVIAVETDRRAALASDNEVGTEKSLTLRIAADEPIDPALYGSEITVRVLRVQALVEKALGYLKAQTQVRLPVG